MAPSRKNIATPAKSMSKWKVPKNIYRPAPLFKIDSIVAGLASGVRPGLDPRWAALIPFALGFARRGLELAIYRADAAHREVNLTPVLADWERAAGIADQAHKALNSLLIAYTGRNPGAPRDLVLGLTTSKAFSEPAGPPRTAAALAAADVLWRARDIARRLAEAAEGQRSGLAADRVHAGNPDHHAFCEVMAETWARLTGARPGANPTGSPFQTFLADAWLDAGGKIAKDGPNGADRRTTAFLSSATRVRHALSRERLAEMKAELRWPEDWGPVPEIEFIDPH